MNITVCEDEYGPGTVEVTESEPGKLVVIWELNPVSIENSRWKYLEATLFRVRDSSEAFDEFFYDDTSINMLSQDFSENSTYKIPVNNLDKYEALKIWCFITTINDDVNENNNIFPSEHQTSLLEDQEFLFESGKFSDVTFIIDKRELKLHKSILSSRSTVLAANFDNDWKENVSNEVYIEDQSYDVMKEFFQYIYAANVNNIDTHVLELLRTADKYAVDKLKTHCEQILAKALKNENAVDYLNVAEKYNAKNLETECDNGRESDSDAKSHASSSNGFTKPRLDGHRFDRKLVCIRYPGNVVNSEKAVETLGGLVSITEAVNIDNRRMELRFRPDDGYCKPACGDKHPTAGLLLRIRVKKSRREKVESASQANQQVKDDTNSTSGNYSSPNANSTNVMDQSMGELVNKVKKCSVDSHNQSSEHNDESERNKSPTFERDKYENLSKDSEYQLPKLKILGRVESEFRFANLCDFQYLPITKNKDDPTKYDCIHDSVYPVGLPPYNWIKEKVPYFLPPAAFSRMDSIQLYTPKTEVQTSDTRNVIGKTRKRRAGLSNFINFKNPNVPTNPPKGIETAMKVKFLQTSHLETMKKLFEERPIWSKTALQFVTQFTGEQLKVLLPSTAYYFMTGPWRITWVRLGYDPRKDPKSKIYQTLDYRLKAMHGLHSNVTCKRNYSQYTLPYRNASNSKARAKTLSAKGMHSDSQKKGKMLNENVYIYKPGVVPPSRQMFYQYCDLHVPEIQDMLEKHVGPAPGTPCHEKLGWLPVGFDEMCREIINKQVRVELRKMMNIPENHPTSLPRKRKDPPLSNKKKNSSNKRVKTARTEPTFTEQMNQPVETVDVDDPRESEEEEWEDVSDEAQQSSSEDEHGFDEGELDDDNENYDGGDDGN
ncbi:hypothetical protein QAD02_015638 [Eretmocerus hayati]|uniref:Uncharacterized protein n=1 Tax=Eretmocerus hayati TaxID=131215 RepID=A0ACC2P8T0_9HYME|nr:hypothetical protein QAD02_015638 [Eretmocerus hayati]